MKISEISEARRNPELNPKHSVYSSILKHLSNVDVVADTRNLFVSFTKLDKLGINPTSKYNTPIGVYSYPAEFITSELHPSDSMKELPFAGDSPWANLFSIKEGSNIINLSSMTESEYEGYCDKLKKLIPKLLSKEYIRGMPWQPPEKLIDSFMYKATTQALKPYISGGVFWYVTMKMAQYMSKDRDINTSVAWNYIFRQLGIDGCVDDGNGIIHESEPSQAVFFNPRIIDIKERVANKYAKHDLKRRVTYGKNVQKALAKLRTLTTPEEIADLLFHEDIIGSYINRLTPEMRYQVLQNMPSLIEYVSPEKITTNELLAITRDSKNINEFNAIIFIKNINSIFPLQTVLAALESVAQRIASSGKVGAHIESRWISAMNHVRHNYKVKYDVFLPIFQLIPKLIPDVIYGFSTVDLSVNFLKSLLAIIVVNGKALSGFGSVVKTIREIIAQRTPQPAATA